MGIPSSQAASAVRVSLGHGSSAEEVDVLLDALSRILDRVARKGGARDVAEVTAVP
jgi:cysteine sulfinate desulfinase/cysteine desulfurase-like protein